MEKYDFRNVLFIIIRSILGDKVQLKEHRSFVKRFQGNCSVEDSYAEKFRHSSRSQIWFCLARNSNVIRGGFC